MKNYLKKTILKMIDSLKHFNYLRAIFIQFTDNKFVKKWKDKGCCFTEDLEKNIYIDYSNCYINGVKIIDDDIELFLDFFRWNKKLYPESIIQFFLDRKIIIRQYQYSLKLEDAIIRKKENEVRKMINNGYCINVNFFLENPDHIRIILKFGFNPNNEYKKYKTLLHWAVNNQVYDYSLTSYILKFNYNENIKDENGRTAFMNCIILNREYPLKYLPSNEDILETLTLKYCKTKTFKKLLKLGFNYELMENIFNEKDYRIFCRYCIKQIFIKFVIGIIKKGNSGKIVFENSYLAKYLSEFLF